MAHIAASAHRCPLSHQSCSHLLTKSLKVPVQWRIMYTDTITSKCDSESSLLHTAYNLLWTGKELLVEPSPN